MRNITTKNVIHPITINLKFALKSKKQIYILIKNQ